MSMISAISLDMEGAAVSKKMVKETGLLDFGTCADLEDMKRLINTAILAYGKGCQVEPRGYENYGEFNFFYQREETDAEYNKRTKAVERKREHKKKAELKELARLKKKYEEV